MCAVWLRNLLVQTHTHSNGEKNFLMHRSRGILLAANEMFAGDVSSSELTTNRNGMRNPIQTHKTMKETTQRLLRCLRAYVCVEDLALRNVCCLWVKRRNAASFHVKENGNETTLRDCKPAGIGIGCKRMKEKEKEQENRTEKD